MYVYITSSNWNVRVRNMTKKDVETLVVEHFGVHHKAHKPSPTFRSSLEFYLFQEQPISFWVHFGKVVSRLPKITWFSGYQFHSLSMYQTFLWLIGMERSSWKVSVVAFRKVVAWNPGTASIPGGYIRRYCSRVYGFNFLWSRGTQDSDSGIGLISPLVNVSSDTLFFVSSESSVGCLNGCDIS